MSGSTSRAKKECSPKTPKDLIVTDKVFSFCYITIVGLLKIA